MDISNKTLAILVILAIIVSLIGLFIGRARIVTVGKAPDIETGLVQATITENVDITVTGTPIDFGTVQGCDRISTESNCGADEDCGATADDVFDTADCPSGSGDGDCTGVFPHTGGAGSFTNLTITSVGTTTVDVSYVGDTSLFCKKWGWSASCISGTDNAGLAEEDESFSAKVKAVTTIPCTTLDATWTEMDFRNVDVDGTEQDIVDSCDQFDFFEIYFRIKVPANEPATCAGTGHDVQLTFTGTATP